MQARLLHWLNRLQGLSLREQAMVVLGLPLLVVVLCEQFWFGPERARAAEALKLAARQQVELNELSALLAARPAIAPLPAADQLQRQRDEMLARIEAVQSYSSQSGPAVQWGTVVRATADGTPGLSLTQLRTQPVEVVFSPAMARLAAVAVAGKPAAPAASAGQPSADVPPPALRVTVYRHRADLTVKGSFNSVVGYLQALQRVPGDLRWDRLQLSVAGYPEASAQLSLHTLSNSPETPFY